MARTNVKFTSTNDRPPGAWQLAPGQALTLRSAQGGRIRVARGGLWATFDGPHAGPANDRGDHLLEAGEMIAVQPGERLVVEPASRTASAYVEWEPGEIAGAGTPGGVRVIRNSAPGDVLGSREPATALRLALALAAVGLTAGLWLGAAVESGRHRGDSQVLAGQAPRAGPAKAPAAAPATARTAARRAGPPA